MRLRSHELTPRCLVPRSSAMCIRGCGRVAPHRTALTLRRTCRESLDNKEIGRRASGQAGRSRSLWLEFRTRILTPSPPGTLRGQGGFASVCGGSRDARRADPRFRSETDETPAPHRPPLAMAARQETLDIFRQYLPSSTGEVEIFGI